MEPAGFIDASFMQNADAIAVLTFGALVGQVMYPMLAKRGIQIKTTHKFAIGSAFSAVAIICAIIVEYQIRAVYESSGGRVSILFQAFSFAFIGAGEIFAISAAYEAAFLVAPKSQKALASAFNLFLVGGIPSFLSMGLDAATEAWFTDPSTGTSHITSLDAYVRTELPNFWWLILSIAVLGILINLLPPVNNWVDQIEKTAQENILAMEQERSNKNSKAIGTSGEESGEDSV